MSPIRRLLPPSSFLLLLCLPFVVHGDGPAGPPDPVPLRRVWLTPDGVAREMERARQGLLVRLPRDEFDDLVRRAGRAEAARKNPPRLVAAFYHGRLVDGGLAGALKWKVIHTADGPGLLPLAPLNLALRQPRLAPLNPEPGRPPGGPDACIGDFDGRDPSLLIQARGEYEASNDWSARAETRPDELQFDLRFPACPATVFELDLPPDKIPVVDGGALGPDDADAPNLRRWTIPCGARSQVALLIRSADMTPVLRAGLETTQVLSPDGLDATYAFSVKSLHQGVRELVFECDPALRPYEVDAPELDRWDLAPPGPKGAPARLTVRLSTPLDEGTVRIRCIGPLAGATHGPGPLNWSSPGVRLFRSVNGGETLVLKVHPDLRLADVESGEFRLQEAATEKAPDGGTEFQRLTFLGGGLAEAGGRPRARLQPHAIEFRARQVAWWRVDPSSLLLQTTYDVTCGRLFQLAVRLPAEWEVDGVELAPDDLLRNWSVRTENGVRVLIVDLKRALGPTEKPGARGPRLTVAMRPNHPGEVLGKELPFPDAEPLGARFREGALAIGFDSQTHQLEVETADAAAPPEDEGPWQKDIPSYYYPYRQPPGAGRPAPAGKLKLLLRAPQVRAQITSDVVLSAGQVSVDTRLRLEAEQGRPDSVDLYLSAPAAAAASGDPWNWRAEQGGVEVRGAHRLPDLEAAALLTALGAADPLGGAAFLLAQPRGECWRVTFSRPLSVHDPIVLHATLTPKLGAGPLAIPLTAVLGASQLEGEATLHLAAASPLQVEALGLREASSASAVRPHGAAAWRTFRYNGAAIGLALVGELPGGDRPPEATVDWAALTTYVRGDGGPEHHYAFQVSHWTQNTLPLQMPAGARVVAFQVDGVWSPLPPAAEDGPGGPVIDLPAPARAGEPEASSLHRYEVVYSTPAATAGPVIRIEAPAPSPPVPPAVFRRLWRLAPEFSPLDDDRLRRRPGPGEGTPSAAPPLRPEDLFRVGPEAPLYAWPWLAGRDEARRSEALPGVLRSLRGREKKTRPIGAVLGDTAAVLRTRGEFLVVDAASLRDAGVDPDRGVTLKSESDDETAPWDDLGLTAASLRGGCLLTTRRQQAAWSESAGTAAVPEAVASAAAEAARRGRDASGRFQAAAVWAGASSEEKSPLPSPEMDLAAWTEWEPAAGGPDAPSVVIVRRPLFEAAGWALAVLLGLAFLGLGRWWKRARLGLLLFWLAAAGLGLLWLPVALQGLAWPALLLGCAGAVAWRVGSALRGPAKASTRSRSTVAAVGSAALLLLVMSGRGRPADSPAPAATTVYLVPGDDDAPDKTFVLVPPELLDRLRTLARPGAGPAAVPVSAEYKGEVVGGVAEIDARFQVVCFTNEATTVALPLDGVQLCRSPKNPDAGEVQVGGVSAKATALPAPQAGVAVPIRGGLASGALPRVELVELHFRAPATGTDEERAVKFTVPRLPQSRLVLQLPRGSTFIQAPFRHGTQNPVDGDPYTLDVDVGGLIAPLLVRWVPESALALGSDIQVKEAYLWDLGVDSSSLTALLSYTISPGGTSSLAVRLPRELDALAVEARRPRDGTALHLRDWKVADVWAERTLTLDFPSPVSGDVEVTLELAPRSPWPASFVLPLPEPVLPEAPLSLPVVGACTAGLLGSPLGQGPYLAASAGTLGRGGTGGGRFARPKASYLAYRTHGLNVERVNPVGVTGIALEDFAPFWPVAWPDAPRPDAHSLAYASTLSREDGGRPPVLGLKVHPAATADAARVDLEVRVGPAQADVRASTVLTGRAGALSLVEWQARSAQPFTVTGVAGPNVRRWSQEGNRVLAWLDPPAKGEVKLELTGWLPLALASGPRLELPNLRVSSASSQETTVHLIPAGGVALAEAGRLNLTPVEPKPAGGVLAYTAGGREEYGGAWRVHSGPPRVRVYTVAGLVNRRLSFVAVMDVEPVFGGVAAMEVCVRNWAGNVDIKEPKGIRPRPLRRGPDEWAWALEQDPGKPGRLRVVLSGEQSGEAAAGGAAAVTPEVTVPGAARIEQWAAVGGTDLTAEAALGLAPADGSPTDLAADSEAAKMGKASLVWKATAPEWRLNLAPRDASSSAAPIEVYLAEYRAAPADGGRWLHEAVYWLRHDANADLNLTLPGDAEVLSVAIDDDEAAPLQAEARRLWLPLTGRPAVCRVRVRWRYTAEEWARPDLHRPTLQGAAEAPGVWTLFAPPGWRLEGIEGKADLQSGMTQAAALSWQRAEALLRISAALAQQAAEGGGDGPLVEAQRRFYAECRRAREELEESPEGSAPGWPGDRKPADVLQDLLERNKNLAKERHFDTVRADAESAVEKDGAGRATGAEARVEEGRPLYAWAAGGAPAPKATLTPEIGRQPPAWAAAALWLSLLLLIGLLSLSPTAGSWSRALWPEQIALLGLVGWWATGALTVVVASLLLLAIVGRFGAALRAVGRLFRRPPPRSKSPTPVPALPEPSGS